jgi:hypothetical protein
VALADIAQTMRVQQAKGAALPCPLVPKQQGRPQVAPGRAPQGMACATVQVRIRKHGPAPMRLRRRSKRLALSRTKHHFSEGY